MELDTALESRECFMTPYVRRYVHTSERTFRWPGGDVSAWGAVDLSSIPAFAADLLTGPVTPVTEELVTPVATLPGAWRYRVSAGTGWPGVSIRRLGVIESRMCNFFLSVAARTHVCANPSLRYNGMLLGP